MRSSARLAAPFSLPPFAAGVADSFSLLPPLRGEMPPAYAGAGSGRGGGSASSTRGEIWCWEVALRTPPLSQSDISPRKGRRVERGGAKRHLPPQGGENGNGEARGDISPCKGWRVDSDPRSPPPRGGLPKAEGGSAWAREERSGVGRLLYGPPPLSQSDISPRKGGRGEWGGALDFWGYVASV